MFRWTRVEGRNILVCFQSQYQLMLMFKKEDPLRAKSPVRNRNKNKCQREFLLQTSRYDEGKLEIIFLLTFFLDKYQ